MQSLWHLKNVEELYWDSRNLSKKVWVPYWDLFLMRSLQRVPQPEKQKLNHPEWARQFQGQNNIKWNERQIFSFRWKLPLSSLKPKTQQKWCFNTGFRFTLYCHNDDCISVLIFGFSFSGPDEEDSTIMCKARCNTLVSKRKCLFHKTQFVQNQLLHKPPHFWCNSISGTYPCDSVTHSHSFK